MTTERIKTIRDALLPLDDAWDALNSLLAELDAARAREVNLIAERNAADARLAEVEVERDAAEKQVATLREALKKVAPYSCPECGDHVKVDEDGCCTMCGNDAALAEGEDTREAQ